MSPMQSALPDDPERQRVLALLQRFGHGSSSFQTLGPDFHYWFHDDDACLAYVDTGHAWVVGGLPIAAQDRYGELVAAFQKAARAHHRRVRYVTLDSRFTAAAGLDTLCFGEIPIWDPTAWESTVRASRSLREQFRRARAKGIRTRLVPTSEVSDATSPVRRAMAGIVAGWMQTRRAPPLRFIARVDPFFLTAERRYVAAEWHGRLIAFLVAVPVYARNGWMIETVFRTRDTPNGVSELLVDAAMRVFAETGATFATLGAAPLTDGVNGWLRLGRWLGSGLYNFQGIYAFKAKLKPQRWEPIHIAYAHGGSAVVAFWDVAQAFSPTDKRALALGILRRYRRPIVLLLAILLIPWTLLLASLDTARWYPSEAAQSAWVAFDIGLIGLCAMLALRWRPALAVLTACLAGLDTGLTTYQAVVYNIPRITSVGDGVGIGIAVFGPLLAATFLWLAHRNSSPAGPQPLDQTSPVPTA
ncbi:MAG: DUF2156 domain-containing protein [Candidatus Sericytochromatia bacterium]|nr:DUF2156 domain-containing protein [Candidatus Sericytochromatia bacterium]